ncbi:hypothetical protein CVT26_008415 [Gymnopilus dilepis]|uniref:Uncharacterized protein n=1 Tax=Gymnopilus dilepis TaxID=231916 RepID=A0A409WNU4_9AGAR|nr:hypothetical protein CVT26_008415 [Gymnopilus dilepis]
MTRFTTGAPRDIRFRLTATKATKDMSISWTQVSTSEYQLHGVDDAPKIHDVLVNLLSISYRVIRDVHYGVRSDIALQSKLGKVEDHEIYPNPNVFEM